MRYKETSKLPVFKNGHYRENIIGTDYVVGDIHGCYDELKKSLHGIGFDFKKDRLFCVGDIMDRGRDSIKCGALLYEDWFYSVLGNHEVMFLEFMVGWNANVFLQNGGEWVHTQAEDDELNLIFDAITTKCHSSITIENADGKFGLIHTPGKDFRQDWNDISATEVNVADRSYEKYAPYVWSRTVIQDYKTAIHYGFDVDKIDKYKIENVDLVYVGHTPVKRTQQIQNIVYTDHGVVFGMNDTFPIYKVGKTKPENF